MKRMIFLIPVIVLALVIGFADSSFARGYHGYGGYRHGPGGFYAAGAILGGILLGTVIGTAISQPPPPRPVYVYPGPRTDYEAPPGEWVVVPGRWIDGRWVPSHRVWVPADPY